MPKPTSLKRELFAYTLRLSSLRVYAFIFVSVFLASFTGLIAPVPAHAATADTINFQARLMTNNGAIAADGDYNVTFRLYNTSSNSSSGGTPLWTEQWLNSNGQGIHVANGYLVANLGSITPFPTSINWSQPLWITMDIGGTGSTPTWDGEMTPSMQLTAVPYAFSAGGLSTTSGSNSTTVGFATPTATNTITVPDSSGTLCLQGDTNCGFAPSSGSTNYIQNQNTAAQTSSNFWIDGTGEATTFNATSALQTAGVTRVDASGNLLNIGNISGSGTINLTGTGNSSIMGALGLGVANPQAGSSLTIANGNWIASTDAAGNGFINMFQVNSNNEIQVGAALNVGGGIMLPADAGAVTLVDMPFSSGVTAGTPNSYTFGIGQANALTIYAENDGSGNAQNVRVAIGSSITPTHTLEVGGTLNVSSTTTIGGDLGVGTASPAYPIDVVGDLNISGYYRQNGNIVVNTSASSHDAFFGISGNTTTTGAFNAALGIDTLQAITSGTGNVAVGSIALNADTTGYNNSALGVYALQYNTTGSSNVAVGISALQSNTTGNYDVALGGSALNNLTTLSGSITGTANNGGNAQFTTGSTTGLTVGAQLTISGTTSYNGTYTVQSVDSSTTFTINATYSTADAAGSWTTGAPDGNVAIGFHAGAGSTSGYYAKQDTLMGYQAGYSLQSGANNNTGIGYSALHGDTTGVNNIAVGTSALYTNTTGYGNDAIGTWSLYSNTTGYNNTAIGNSSLFSNSTGFTDTALGYNTLYSNTTGSENTGVGNSALYANTTGNYNVAVGYQTLQSNTTASYSTAVGYQALQSNTTGYGNDALGTSALAANTTGNYNVATGYHALQLNTTGQYNNAFGGSALATNTTGNYNAAVGYQTLQSNTTGQDNSAFGTSALSSNTTGNYNVAVGYATLLRNTTGSEGIAIGQASLYYLSTLSGSITATASNGGDAQFTTGSTTGLTAGTQISISGTTSYNGTYTIKSVDSSTTFTIYATYSTADAAGSWTTGAPDGNVAIGYQAGQGSTNGYFATGNTLIGLNAGYSLQSGANNNTALGNSALFSNTTGFHNTALGYNALYSNTTGESNTALGNSALFSNTTGYSNTAIGVSALQANTTGSFDIALGASALQSNTTGSSNTAIGVSALQANTTGYNNTALGSSSLSSNTSGYENTSIGYNALATNSGGYNNVAFGTAALQANTTGYNNTALGYNAGANITAGSNNIILGASINAPNAVGSNQLDIGNALYGNLSTGDIGIGTSAPGAKLEVNSGTAGSSGIRLTQLTTSSTPSSAFTGILGVNSSGDIGLSTLTPALAEQALAYWDGNNDPTTGNQAYPTPTMTGSATYSAGNGVELTPAVNNDSGSLNWSFSQQQFERVQFRMKAGGGSGADSTWFYTYANGVPSAEWGGGSFTQGYIVYFDEYHGCIGLTYGPFSDGNQCGSGGGGTNPLTSVAISNIANNSWHDVDISFLDNHIIVRWDGKVVIDYTDVYTRNLSATDFGFGARTGGLNNYHYIKGLAVAKLGTNMGNYKIDTVTAIQSNLYWDNGTNDLGVGNASPQYPLDVTGDINTTGYYRQNGNIVVNTSTGTSNTFIGVNAGNTTTTGSNNAALGTRAFQANTTGGSNVALDTWALQANTTGSNNIALGYQSLYSNTTGDSNIALGTQALQANTTASNNIALGYQSLYSNTTGGSNIALGTWALQANTTGSNNIALGFQALHINTTGNYNTALGISALYSNTTGGSNVALGNSALQANTSGGANTALGYQSLQANTSGFYNNALGYQALQANATGGHNTALGTWALQSNTTGSDNNALGYQALQANTTGSDNIAIGESSLSHLSTLNGSITGTASNGGKAQFTTGSTAGLEPGTPITITGSTSYNGAQTVQSVDSSTTFTITATYSTADTSGSWVTNDPNGNVAVGYQSGQGDTNGYFAIQNTLVGYQAGYSLQSGAVENTALGYTALYSNTTGNSNVAVGVSSLNTNTSGSHNVAVGSWSLQTNTSGYDNTALGTWSLTHNTTGAENVALGKTALYTNSTGSYNIAVGSAALLYNSSGTYNAALGAYALQDNTTGNWNAAVGPWSLQYNTTGYDNAALGDSTLEYNTTGYENTAVGPYALEFNNTGNDNSATGAYALQDNSSGSYNSASGVQALQYNTTGSWNTAAGYQSLGQSYNGTYNSASGYESFDGLASVNGSISATASNGGNAQFTTSSTAGLAAGMSVTVSGTTSYNSTYTVQSVDSSTTFTINATYSTADAAGSWVSVPSGNVGAGAFSGWGYATYSSLGNTMLGYKTGYNLENGANLNTFTGYEAGLNVTTGANNVLIGSESGSNISSGSNNIIIGPGVNAANGSGSNQLNIGNVLYGDTSAGNLYLKSDSVSAFQVQNAAGGSIFNVDTNGSSINVTSVSSWTTATNALPLTLASAASVTYNGYAYVMGGQVSGGAATNAVYYAPLNADGSVGTWTTATNSLPQNVWGAASVTYNGYVYVMGGYATGYTSGDSSTVYYAKLNADGSVGTWTTATNALPQALDSAASVTYNGYVYVMGGQNSIGVNTVYYAKLNADGSVGTWTTATNSLPQSMLDESSVTYNGYVYVMGGYASGASSTVYYAKLNADGSVGTWTTATNALPQAVYSASSVTYNGYAYVMGGHNVANSSAVVSTVYYAQLVGQAAVSAGGISIHANTVFNGTVEVTGQSSFKNATNSTTAFQIQNASGTALLTADTTNMKLTVQSLVVSLSLTVDGHIITGGSSVSIGAGAQAGTSPTTGGNGNDEAGTVTITTGTGSAAGALAVIDFSSAYSATPRVVLEPTNAASAALEQYVTATTTGFTINTANAPTDSTTYTYNYHVEQ